ncbi:MAG: LacI family DNA-binding transcriptional regulator [Candidatus Eremiobacteraeota bacterium]|nr:LacI family DNA-binding transcriptional regulator [Candidatus Eremiobacteraeota bacterium]
MNVGIKDVARRAGVSISSVSRVLNSSFPVTEQMRESVYRAVKDLNYRVDQRARSLRRQRSGTIALLVSEVGNSFFPGVLHAIERAADENDFCLYFCNADEDERRQAVHIESMIDQRIEGLIVMPVTTDAAALTPLLENGIPTVLLDRVVTAPVADAVLLDNEGASELVIAHLHELGHRRIALVTIAGNPAGDSRLAGARKAAMARGCEIGPVIDYVGELKESGGYAQMQALLAAPVPPTAVVFVNNRMAVGGLAALRANGLRLPSQVSAVTFDDVPWADLIDPPMTTVRQPLNEIGRKAIELLLDRIEGRLTGPPREIRLPGTLLVRQSTGPVPHPAIHHS